MASVTTQTIQRSGGSINDAFVGVDTALAKTGVCILRDNQAELSLICTRGLRGAQRLSYIDAAIRELIDSAGNPVLGAVEGGAFDAGGRLFQLGQVQGIAQLALYQAGIDLIEVAPNRLKKFFANHGGAKKDKMIEAAKHALGVEELDDNLADAYALASLAEAYHLQKPQTRKQAEVILDVDVEQTP